MTREPTAQYPHAFEPGESVALAEGERVRLRDYLAGRGPQFPDGGPMLTESLCRLCSAPRGHAVHDPVRRQAPRYEFNPPVVMREGDEMGPARLLPGDAIEVEIRRADGRLQAFRAYRSKP